MQDKSEETEAPSLVDPFITFKCSHCNMSEKCLFGEVKAEDGFYTSSVFYMRDPFAPPVRVRTRKPILSDFLIVGACCTICEQSTCIDKACSVFFGSHFCADCVIRERRRFPQTIIDQILIAQSKTKIQ